MSSMTFNKRLGLGFGLMVVMLLVVALVAVNATRKIRINETLLTGNNMPVLLLLGDTFNLSNHAVRAMSIMQLTGNATAEEKARSAATWSDVMATSAKIVENLDKLGEMAKQEGNEGLRRDLDAFVAKRSVFVEDRNHFKEMFDKGDMQQSREFLIGKMETDYVAYREALKSMQANYQDLSIETARGLNEIAGTAQIMVIVAAIAGFGLAVVIVIVLLGKVRSKLGGELEVVEAVMNKIANGDYSGELKVAEGDQQSLLAQAATLRAKLHESAALATKNARVRAALDAVSTSVMIADADRNIIYMNRAQEKLMRDVEADLRRDLPQFNAATIIGSNIDQFHKNPSHQQGMLERLFSEHRADIAVGGHDFALTVTPVFAADGRTREGYAVEWKDQTEFNRMQERERAAAQETARLMGALEACSSNVMMADNDRKIIYMNPAVRKMLGEAQSELRKVLPHFDMNTLIGSNMDVFHKNPSHQAGVLANMASTYKAEITVAGLTMTLIANPVYGKDGKRIGSVVEWINRTAEVAIEREVAGIIDAAVQGDFSRRIDTAGKEGFMRRLVEGINQLMTSNEAGMNDVARVLGAIARGDLTENIDADYRGLLGQLKDDCNTTCERLSDIVVQIKDAAGTINMAAEEIAAGNNNLSSRTEQQAASLEETASSMEELTSTVKQNAENAKQANQLAIGASEIAVKGGDVVSQVVATMSEINDSAKKIVDIISVIDGIAFQTNILALNAAVEAARAGEQGRGFAVVASEVRNLAQRSAGAAKEIKSLIGDSVLKVEMGSKLVDQAGHTMEEVVGAVRRVTDIMSEISAASNEQSTGIEQVNQAVMHMDENTQQNAALVEEAAAAAESLQEQASGLNQTIGIFKLNVGQAVGNLPKLPHKPVHAPAAAKPARTASATKPAAAVKSKIRQMAKPEDDNEEAWEEF